MMFPDRSTYLKTTRPLLVSVGMPVGAPYCLALANHHDNFDSKHRLSARVQGEMVTSNRIN
jgi:hypothetical protein